MAITKDVHIDPEILEKVAKNLDTSTENMWIEWEGDSRKRSEILSSKEYLKPNHIGKAQLYVVNKKIDKYVPGEIAHIENILPGERKERTHRTLARSEMTFTKQEETTEEKTNELETTDRFELDKESEKIIKKDLQMEGGVDVTAKYGTVKINSHVNGKYSLSKEEKDKVSSNYARETINKTVNAIKERVFEERKRKRIMETEITNLHTLSNESGTKPIRGIYRWLDKIYDVEQLEVGERMMFDFIIPEPARFFKYAARNKHTLQDGPVEPEPHLRLFGKDQEGDEFKIEKPKEPLLPEHITENNYQVYASKYDAEIKTPPLKTKRGNIFITKPEQTQQGSGDVKLPEDYVETKEIKIDQSYEMIDLSASGYLIPDNSGKNAYLDFNSEDFHARAMFWSGDIEAGATEFPIMSKHMKNNAFPKKGKIAISTRTHNAKRFTIVYQYTLQRTNKSMDDWRINTYNTIIQAYRNRKAEFEDRLAAKKAAETGSVDFGTNPALKKEIIDHEMKKNVISIFRGNHFEDIGAISKGPEEEPQIDILANAKQEDEIQFFEHAIEWNNMMYVFYPYYWAEKDQWAKMLLQEDDDFDFRRFLRAGSARVVVPIRPTYEDAMEFYIETGKTYNGEGERPNVKRDDFIPIWEEKKNIQHTKEERDVKDAWKAKVPTSLVYLEDSSLENLEFEEF